MRTMRIASLSLAVAAGILSTQAMAVDFTGYARSGIGWSGSGGDQQKSCNHAVVSDRDAGQAFKILESGERRKGPPLSSFHKG